MGVTQASPTTGRLLSVEGLAPPPGGYLWWDDYMAEFEQVAALDAWDDACRRVQKAMRLSPTLDVFRALLDGQPVPVDALDPEWARRYGL